MSDGFWHKTVQEGFIKKRLEKERHFENMLGFWKTSDWDYLDKYWDCDMIFDIRRNDHFCIIVLIFIEKEIKNMLWQGFAEYNVYDIYPYNNFN